MQYTYARKTLEALWRGLCRLADMDNDELITMDEWIRLMRKSMHDIEAQHFDEIQFHWFNEYQNFMFKLFDVSRRRGGNFRTITGDRNTRNACEGYIGHKFFIEDGYIDLVEYADGMSIYGYRHHESVEAFRSFAFVCFPKITVGRGCKIIWFYRRIPFLPDSIKNQKIY